MWRRAAQMAALLFCILGWGLVGCTLAMDHWRVAQLGGQGGSSVVEISWFWSDLWKDCYEDSTALVNCVDFGVLWTVKPYIQAVRGLLITGLCLGLIGATLMFFGMECTRIGGDQRSKNRTLITASAFHVLGCEYDLFVVCAQKASGVLMTPTRRSVLFFFPCFLDAPSCRRVRRGRVLFVCKHGGCSFSTQQSRSIQTEVTCGS
uniref:Claudin-10-like n=1 Tax=Acanthochromis polyacanthus TaxID=80966 RepID=A0A3Q1FAP1_9TELE